MVARKSSRVKKSPVVYQAPEAVPRAVRAPSTQKQAVVNRRIFDKDVDLQMECVDDELSAAQLKALKEAQQEHDKANEMIKEVRAGNILVPSSQPNTFTIVPPKPPQPPPQQTPPPVPQQQAPPIQLQKLPSPPEEAGSQRGLPPPRPAQFLNKQLQEISKSQGSRAPDVLLISDNSNMTGGPKLTTQTLLGTQISTQPLQFQQMTLAGHQVTMSGGAGVMPQQVYKFVSLPSNMQPNIVPNQWALRPLLTVSPQQQQQMSLVGSNQQGVPQFATMTLAQQPRILAARPAQVSVPSKISKIDAAAKRPASTDVAVVEPPAKKRAGKEEVQDDTGNWVPLDEYYYGTHEGDPSYTEEKGEYRFKCWYCSKMLYNNVRAMQHIQGHIDASKQQNIDLSDLTQCKHCYKQFDTPFEMQTHVEKVHLSNKVLMCRICERDFSTPRELTQHMKGNHHACEMPYICHLCNFRSSMYSDVVDHFKKRHDSSHFMLCLYCLRTFEVKFVSQGWGQTQTYYGHLLKHQTKSSTKKCVVCRLTFFNAIDVKTHRKNCHVGNHLDVKALSHSGKTEAGSSKKRGSQLKSLNAPSVSRIQDYGTVVFPEETNSTKCIECKMTMSSNDHYKKYVHCTMCRFATSCSVAYAKHMMGFHSGQMSSLNMNIPWERPMKDVMYCACGFKSVYGNKVANHLVYCGKWTCYSTQVQASDQTAPSKVEERTEGSLLGMLGLVSKDQVIPTDDDAEIISSKPRPKCKTKLAVDTRETKASTADTEVITVENTKPAVDKKQSKDNTEVITEDKANIDEKESKSSENPPKLDDKKGQEEEKQSLETKLKEPGDDQPSTSVEKDKAKLNEAESKDDSSAEVLETVKNVEEHEKKSVEDEEKITKESMKEDKPQGMEKEIIGSLDAKIESENEQKDQTASLEVNNGASKTTDKDQDSEPNLKTSSEELMEIGDGDSGRKKESDEMLQEKKEELEISTDTVDNKVTDEETKAEQDKEKEVDKDSEVHDLAEDTGAENMEEGKLEEKSEDGQTPEVSDKVKEKESESVEENKQDSMVIEDSTVTAEDKSKEKQDSSISAETEPETSGKDQAGDLECRESQSSDHHSSERDHQSLERDRQSHEHDRQSHERDRQSRERDRHSSERERHHSGGRHEDRPHQDDRHHHDNRSYGSNRSDGYHGNRPYEQNRDRDRSSDRDYNRNQGYRQGDNRSGYGGYQDNRGQGYGGGGNYRGQGGQYGGYHGNRGGHYQDRNRGGNQQGNFNRNYQNRGGYNQNYRGGGYGGGYY